MEAIYTEKRPYEFIPISKNIPQLKQRGLTPYGIYEKLQTKLVFDQFFVIPISEMWGKNVHSFYLRPKG